MTTHSFKVRTTVYRNGTPISGRIKNAKSIDEAIRVSDDLKFWSGQRKRCLENIYRRPYTTETVITL